MAGAAGELRATTEPAAAGAARSQWARIEALRRNRVFLVDYAVARASWRDGEAVTFPIGTYWLRRFANVPIAAA
jgi:ABC-type Fe3+-hydroxamate transport system substrate-binding protein